MENKTLTTQQSVKLINKLYDALPYNRDINKLFGECKQNEKDHRKSPFCAGRSYGISVAIAAKYFTIRALYHGMLGVQGKIALHTIKDLLNIRYDYLLGQCIAMNDKNDLQEWFLIVDNSDFEMVDYSEMVK